MTTRVELELHGHEGLPFPNFVEDASYLERVTLPTREEAGDRLRAEGLDTEDENLVELFMRYGPAETEEQALELSGWADEGSPAWWECEENHPDAVPFWKDG